MKNRIALVKSTTKPLIIQIQKADRSVHEYACVCQYKLVQIISGCYRYHYHHKLVAYHAIDSCISYFSIYLSIYQPCDQIYINGINNLCYKINPISIKSVEVQYSRCAMLIYVVLYE